MTEKRNFYSCFSIFTVLFCVVLCCTLSCKNKSNAGRYDNAATQTDSVDLFIDQSQNNTNSVDDRRRYLDKAYSLVQKKQDDTPKIRQLTKIQWNFLDLQDSLQFRQSNRQTRKLARALNDSLRIGITDWDLGTFFNRENLKDSAFFYLNNAQKIFISIRQEEEAGITLYDIARLQARVKDYTGSESNAIRAIEFLKPLEDYAMLYRCFNLLGVVTKDLGEYERALEYYNTAIEYLQKIEGSNTTQLAMYNNIGVVHRELGNFEEAKTNFIRTLSTDSLQFKTPKLYARALNNWAYCKFKAGDPENIESEFKQALHIRNNENDLEGLAGSNYYLAEFYLARKDSGRAQHHALEAKKFAELSQNNDRLLETLALIPKINPGNSAEFSLHYFDLNDSLLKAERQVRNKFARIQFETEEVEAENLVLARQNQLWIGIALGVFLLALLIFIIISQRIRNQKLKFQQQQQEANNEIFSLMMAQNQKIEEGKKSEQKRISEELHDGVLGEMNGARMILMGLNQKTDENAIAMRSSAISKLQEVQEEIRTISHELSDAAYQKFHNFIISIQELLTSVGNSAALEHSFTYEEQIDWDNLSADITINLYRIIQECLMNCVKHASAKNIFLDITAEGEVLLVQIEDDGKGFDPKKGKKGIGHKNISSRVEKINGSWSVNSAKGDGTLVTIKIPLVYSTSPLEKELVSKDK
ncbi:tetratricopeptide repeat-containing sensor histidine kinase [Muriicola sp. Z0-33]|uniref:tetratricopeptide repeat-containing sensor histidine kinase n=1 Tax=Muriicola sp. Z0-33 TaxID=2816957 RepID=UPI002237D49E|nr:tetratricopeptide repeat-containing sensor histidine kinase [Muriicola sp. Z0-33]MCW5516567.1 tetratricopeptide repeat protein [Muriicola sp. Z0-33]